MPPKGKTAKCQDDQCENDQCDTDQCGPQGIDPRLLAQLQAQLENRSSGYIEGLPKSVQRRVKALKNLQVKHAKLNAQYEKEVAQLELKYHALHQPLFAKRTEITSGKYEPTDEEATFEDDEEEEDDEEKKDDEETKETEAVSGIPHFWLTALQRSDLIAEKIQTYDVPVLEHLTDITVDLNENAGTGFKLNFHFSKNDFFTDAVLTKTYTIDLNGEEDVVMYTGPVFSSTTGCEIHWNTGKNVTVKSVQKKQKKKGGKDAGAVRVITKIEKVDSFFNFFSPPAQPAPDSEDPKAAEDMAAIEEDFEIGDIIREKLVSNAVLWFTGEALEYEGYDDDDYGEGEDGDYGEDDDEDDDEDDHKGKPKPKAVAGAPGAPGAKPECKQS